MPQVDRVATEFAGEGVQLIAINLQESRDKIRSALERLKLETTVALDKEGRVAERYGATAIPQTVIIDRAGNVARVFVGGGPRFEEQLRQALKGVIAGTNSEPAPADSAQTSANSAGSR
jgi:peroxiredoxin